jgi:hypothetical protein
MCYAINKASCLTATTIVVIIAITIAATASAATAKIVFSSKRFVQEYRLAEKFFGFE